MGAVYDMQKQFFGKNASDYNHYYGFDVPLDRAAQAVLTAAIREELQGTLPDSRIEGAAEVWDEFIGIYGGLLFLGLTLGLTFILAAALIMYYKQVTEGYEDNERFDILKKVGMTGREVRKTINSQVLTVFSLPLAAAAVHMAFAFPMVSKLLKVFSLSNVPLFMAVTGATIAVFAMLYVGAYLVTSRAYLAIVSGMNGRLHL
jgi:putative ABC transport system permease protein